MRTLAALAHASVILPVTKLLAPILIWLMQRSRSPFVAFQALQAAIVQGFMEAITALVLYSIVAAVLVFQGHDFRYFWVASLVDNMGSKNHKELTMNTSSYPSQDERVMAALAHITILIPTIGVIAPIVIWATQKDKSRYVAFQALQAAAFQLLIVVLWFVGMACYMGSFFALIGGAAVTHSGPGSGEALMFLPFLVFFGLLLIMLLFVILGTIAAVMAFQGKDFRYPLIGDWVARYTQSSGTPTGTAP